MAGYSGVAVIEIKPRIIHGDRETSRGAEVTVSEPKSCCDRANLGVC